MTLAEKLEEIREGSKERIPEKILHDMERAVGELRDSGQAGEAVGPGDNVPSFELPNIAGETISSGDLLRPGGLVLTFYRGVW